MQDFLKLRRNIEETISYKSDPEGNVVNITAFSLAKSEYKPLRKKLNLIPTPKVRNKNDLDSDINNFFRLVKLKAHCKGSIKILKTKTDCLKQTKTKVGHQAKIIMPLTILLKL